MEGSREREGRNGCRRDEGHQNSGQPEAHGREQAEDSSCVRNQPGDQIHESVVARCPEILFYVDQAVGVPEKNAYVGDEGGGIQGDSDHDVPEMFSVYGIINI